MASRDDAIGLNDKFGGSSAPMSAQIKRPANQPEAQEVSLLEPQTLRSQVLRSVNGGVNRDLNATHPPCLLGGPFFAL